MGFPIAQRYLCPGHWRQEQDLNLHTPRDVSLASDEVRYRSAHPTDTYLAETIRFERMVPFRSTLR